MNIFGECVYLRKFKSYAVYIYISERKFFVVLVCQFDLQFIIFIKFSVLFAHLCSAKTRMFMDCNRIDRETEKMATACEQTSVTPVKRLWQVCEAL